MKIIGSLQSWGLTTAMLKEYSGDGGWKLWGLEVCRMFIFYFRLCNVVWYNYRDNLNWDVIRFSLHIQLNIWIISFDSLLVIAWCGFKKLSNRTLWGLRNRSRSIILFVCFANFCITFNLWFDNILYWHHEHKIVSAL